MKAIIIIQLMLTLVVGLAGQVYTGLDLLDIIQDEDQNRDPDLGLRGGYGITASGTLRVPIIFVDREDETIQSTNWPLGGDPVDMQQFINSQPPVPEQQWPRLNMTKYMYVMSNGLFNIIGDVYRYTIPSGLTFSNDLNLLSSHVLAAMDPGIDYSVYDQWSRISPYNHSLVPDGIVDYIYLIYRFPISEVVTWFTSTGYTPIGAYQTQDGVAITSILGYAGGSVQGGMRNSGFSGMTHVCLHELSHSLFWRNNWGGHNGRLAGLAALSANQVGWGFQIWGMNAWEREKLGWMNYNTVSADAVVQLPDYITSGTAIKIPTTDPNRFYFIENRQRLDPEFDTAFGSGIYIYRAIDTAGPQGNLVSQQIYNPVNLPEPRDGYNNSSISGNYDGSVNVLSADGRWNFVHNLSPAPNYSIDDPVNIRIEKTTPNPRGYDERDYCGKFQYGNTNSWSRYYCRNDSGSAPLYNWYEGDPINECHVLGDGFGDVYDGFSIGYNSVFSKWSNPGIDQSWANCNFSIEIQSENQQTGVVTLRLRFTNPQNAPLARPMGLSGTSSNGISYAVNWYQPNTELQPGFQSYELYHRRSTTSAWNLIASITDQNINLSIPYVGNPNIIPIHKRNYFRVRAVKASPGGESNFSDEIKIVNNDIIIPYYSIPSGKTLSIDDSLTVRVTGSLEMQQNSGLLLGRGSKLIVQEGASLVIGNNCQVKGTNKSIGTETGSAVIINGSVSVGSIVTFSSDIDCWDGLIIDSATQANLTGVSFNNADLVTYSDVTVEACTFSNGNIKQYAKDLTISSSTFNSASIKSVAKLEDSSVNIVSSQFTGSPNQDAIDINSMSKYSISGNSITGYRTALAVYESMNGSIEANEIAGNGTGIQLYHAVADIYNGNAIQNNDYGIVALRNSLWSLQGSKDAPYQFVNENRSCQVLFTYDSAPEYMEFNHIYSTNNSDKAFVVCNKVPSNPKKILIANNYFGTMFDPLKNLIPTEIFIYEPVWVPDPASANVSIIPGLYKTAKDYQRSSDYDAAHALWYQYYSAVPDSSILYDKTAKQLLSVEKLTSDDYSQLLSFYGTTGTTSPISMHLLNYLSNYCLIEVNALQPAILWLESQIENPVTDVDSLFAAIDIGYLYMLVDSSKAAVQGKLPWLKPTSVQAFESDRNNAIMSLINGQSNSQSSTQSVEPSTLLMSNYPNPFNPSTTISFNLPSVMNCKLEIYNLKGQRVTSLLNETRGAGKHTITWDGLDEAGRPVSSGIYFYRLTTPQRTISAKMLMIK